MIGRAGESGRYGGQSACASTVTFSARTARRAHNTTAILRVSRQRLQLGNIYFDIALVCKQRNAVQPEDEPARINGICSERAAILQ